MEKTKKYLIHPSAILAPDVKMGEGVKIGPYVVIGENVQIGDNTHIDAHAVIYEHTKIGAGCQIYPSAIIGTPPQDIGFGGEVSQVVIGDNTIIREFVSITLKLCYFWVHNHTLNRLYFLHYWHKSVPVVIF